MTGKIISQKRDINRVRLKEGDIVAEGCIGDTIWDGKAIVLRRPLGIVTVQPDGQNLIEIRRGLVIYKNPDGMPIEDVYTNRVDAFGYFHLSTYDGEFVAWDNVEKVGSVWSLPD